MDLLTPKLGFFFFALIGLALVVTVVVFAVWYLVLKNRNKRSQKAIKQ
ncbi:MAG TPA: hypothetical protein VHS96_02065 [Bacteroidia bacterium]|nr:hypothetical protein [Bacteroidia bacterium]